MTIRFAANGDIESPEFQSVADAVDLLCGARPWTRADYLVRINQMVRDGVPNADAHARGVRGGLAQASRPASAWDGDPPTNEEIGAVTGK